MLVEEGVKQSDNGHKRGQGLNTTVNCKRSLPFLLSLVDTASAGISRRRALQLPEEVSGAKYVLK